MNLLLTRFRATDRSTIGTLAIDQKFFCYTLEDVVREPGVKIPGNTAIDPGTYNVVIGFSTRFKRLMPRVLDVPNFTGILFHWGNSEVDTLGCILVGTSYSTDWVSNSRQAFGIDKAGNILPNGLYAKIEVALNAGEKVTLDIVEMAEEHLAAA